MWLASILVHVFGLSSIVMWNDGFFAEPAPLVLGGLVMIFVVTADFDICHVVEIDPSFR